MRKVCDFIIKYSIYALVLLMPLFFLPWTSELFEFNKQYLLIFLVALSFLVWLIKMVNVDKKILFKRTPLDLWIIVFAAAMILSSIFSLDKVSSWLGFYGRFTDSMIVLLAMLVMYFILSNNIKVQTDDSSAKNVKEGIVSGKILLLFLISSFAVVLIAYLSLFNIWSKIPGLPANLAILNLRTFNTISGSFGGLSIFLVIMLALVTGLLLAQNGSDEINISQRFKIKVVIVYYLLIALSLILLLLIDFSAAWITLGVVMFVLLAIAFWTRLFKDRVNLLLVPIILLIVSITGLTLNTGRIMIDTIFLERITAKQNFLRQFPNELNLDYAATKTVAWKTLKNYPVLGSGPGTFLIDFTQNKPMEFNNGDFWNVRFDKASSQLLELVGTTGVVGVLAYLLFIIILLMMLGMVFLSKKKLSELTAKYQVSDKRHPISVLPLILTWLALFVAQIVYIQNMVLLFYFWLFTALLVVAWQAMQGKAFKVSDFSFDKLPEIGLVMNVVLMILAFGLSGFFYLGGRFYLAELKFNSPAMEENVLIQNSEKAVILNKYRSEYRRSLSQLYLIGAWKEARKPQNEQNLQLLETYARGAIQQARFATLLAPNSVSSWENLAAIYRDSGGLIGGTLPLAIDTFVKASGLEPANPLFHREICRLNLISEKPDVDKALEQCQRAVDLKPNYLDAHVQLALAYEKKGDLEAAVNKLNLALDNIKGISFERGSQMAGAAAEIYFQLGRVQFNLEHYDEALKMFEQAAIVMPQHANARYALALVYQVKGRFADALVQYKIVDQLVPGNEQVQTAIKQLEEHLAPQKEQAE